MLHYNNLTILTGSPGSGKTTLLASLAEFGIPTMPEPARQILAEQRSIAAPGTAEQDPALFIRLMLTRILGNLTRMGSASRCIADRALPDLIAYANLLNVEVPELVCAVERIRFRPRVFYLPPWQEIYRTDEERTMTFEAAAEFGAKMFSIYRELGYQLVELPLRESPLRRVRKLLFEDDLLISRKAQESDFEKIFELHTACFQSVVQAQFGAYDMDWQRNNLLQQGNYRQAELFLEPRTERIVALLIVTNEPADFSPSAGVFLSNLSVHPDYQGLGFGSKLLQDIKAKAPEGVVGLRVLKMNTRALHLYKRLGFSVVGESENHFQMIAR